MGLMGGTAWRMEVDSEKLNSTIGYNFDDYHEEKNQQLHTILTIIVSVFSACCIILVIYMIIFPASSSTSATSTNAMAPSGNNTVAGVSNGPHQPVPLIKRNSQIIE